MHKRGGFTLVEMLIVMAIIALLAGLLLPALFQAQQDQFIRNARAEVGYLQAALEQYKADFGDYPPTFLGDLGDPRTQDDVPNQGNLSLTACLATEKVNGPYMRSYLIQDDEKVQTTPFARPDFDEGDWAFDDAGESHYRLLLDPWGNPYVYFHNRDYSLTQQCGISGGIKLGAVKEVELDVNGDPVPGTETYFNTQSFQLWSLGPNGINDGGKEDDIAAWQN